MKFLFLLVLFLTIILWKFAKRNTFILKHFLQFTCTNLDGSQKEGGKFLNLLHKDGGIEKVGVPSEKEGGGFQPWRELCASFQ